MIHCAIRRLPLLPTESLMLRSSIPHPSRVCTHFLVDLKMECLYSDTLSQNTQLHSAVVMHQCGNPMPAHFLMDRMM